MGLGKVPFMKGYWSAPFTLREMAPCTEVLRPAGRLVAGRLEDRGICLLGSSKSRVAA